MLETALARLSALSLPSVTSRDSPDLHALMMTTSLMPGLDQTPPEEEGDIMYPPTATTSALDHSSAMTSHRWDSLTVQQLQQQHQQLPNSVMLSPAVDGDIW